MKKNYKKAILMVSIILIGFGNSMNAQWTMVSSGLVNLLYGSVTTIVSDGTKMYAGTNVAYGNGGGGVLVSTDNGVNWTQSNTGLTNLNIRAILISGSNIFAGTYGGGIFLSTDNGANWTAMNTGLSNTSSKKIYSLAIIGTTLFAGTDDGLYVSADNGATWTITSIANQIYSFLVDGSTIYAAEYLLVHKSTDNGATWAQSQSFALNSSSTITPFNRW
ncbi:MAG: hypothetical protein V4608_16280 [Bacteroidota bacterium]